ncbi:MAG: lipoate--protein ligase family protein [Coriobacteriales bacterium]|nr:lipoate--protein ligase family protein [Actinomycetes bacterium]
MRTWRVIIQDRVDGALNMGIDKAVLTSVADGEAPPTLRLYQWRVPTVSLGRFQQIADVDREACERRGFDIVRRPTGGRGVLHDDELTYSIVASLADGVPRGVSASYRYLCAALAETYRDLGVPAELTARPRGTPHAAACYLHATNADLSLGAAKLSGSAQVWDRETVLQHGSFVRTRDVTAEVDVFHLDSDAAGELRRVTVTLADALGSAPAIERIVEAVARAVSTTLGVALEPAALSLAEKRRADVFAETFSISRSLGPARSR